MRPALCSATSASSRHASHLVRMQAPQVYATASEDMDSLTFATPKLIRNLMKPATQSVPINEYDYDKAGLPALQAPHFYARTALHGPRATLLVSHRRCWRA